MKTSFNLPNPLLGRREAWERWRARLEQLPDGTWFNPDGIEDESFFQSLEDVRREERLDEQINEGLAQLDRGEGIPGEEVFRALREKSRNRRAVQ